MNYLGVDIGNTTIRFAILYPKTIKEIGTIETHLSPKAFQGNFKEVLSNLRKTFKKVDKTIICSVVPRKTRMVESLLRKYTKGEVKVVGKSIKVPIRNNYRNPKQVGIDRLVGALAAKELYGFPAIIIDFGTAITFDIISKGGAYEGGLIIPGLRLSAESLFHKTAMLPRVDKMNVPKQLVGRDTKSSILSGLFYGYGAMCDGLIQSISREMNDRPRIIITGGYTKLMQRLIKSKIHFIDKDLVFKGLYFLQIS